MRPLIRNMLLALAVLVPAIAPTAVPSYAETRVWGFELEEAARARIQATLSETRIEGYPASYGGVVVGCPPVPRGGVSPSDIKFSQPTISQNFSSKGQVNDLVSGLRSGDVRVGDIPTIRVVEFEGQLITLDNRRLAAFQAAGVKEIPIERLSLKDPGVEREFVKKFKPIDGGKFVVVTPNAAGRKAATKVLRDAGKID